MPVIGSGRWIWAAVPGYPNQILAIILEWISKEIAVHCLDLKSNPCQEMLHLEAEDDVQADWRLLPAIDDLPIFVDFLPGGSADGGLSGVFQ